jgi:Regulator of chromosome condensation (RCC1) repeat
MSPLFQMCLQGPPAFAQMPPDIHVTVALACHAHTLALDACGTVYSWGFGGGAALGHDDFQDVAVPRPVSHLPPCQAIAGDQVSFALTKQNEAFCWGTSPALGHIDPSVRAVPRPALCAPLTERKIARISCGPQHAVALAVDGSLLCWGAVVAVPGSVATSVNVHADTACTAAAVPSAAGHTESQTVVKSTSTTHSQQQVSPDIDALIPAGSSTLAQLCQCAYAPQKAELHAACVTLLTAWIHAWPTSRSAHKPAAERAVALPADGFIHLAWMLGLVDNRVGILQVRGAICYACNTCLHVLQCQQISTGMSKCGHDCHVHQDWLRVSHPDALLTDCRRWRYFTQWLRPHCLQVQQAAQRMATSTRVDFPTHVRWRQTLQQTPQHC